VLFTALTEPDLIADDTSIIVSNPNLVEFESNLISAFQQLNAWFNINLLSLTIIKLSLFNLEPPITKQLN
jgi:hypothetical protein